MVNFYGTTSNAGDGGCCGTVFRITPGGALTTLHFFNGNDGASPIGGLVLGSDGNFYGTTATGLYGSPASNGTVFKITSSGVFSGLHMFNGADGKQPSAALTLGPDGNLYGTTRAGGANSLGTVFRINQGGTLTTVYSFSGTDGATPLAALTLGRDGNLYGTTQQDGANGDGTFFVLGFGSSSLSINSNGIVSAASYNSPVAPGSIAAVFGSFPISVPLSATTTPIAGTLGGLSTYFGNVPPAPLFYASQSQLNVQIPWELEGLSQTTVTVGQSGETSATRTVPIAAYTPGIFVLNTQTNQAAVTDLNNNLISPDNPASPGAYIQIYCTGLGPVTNQPLTGTAALSSPLSWTTITPLVSVGDKTAVVVFSGLVPGEIGLYQVNVQLPSDAPTGSAIPIGISIEGVQSNSVNITVKE